MREELNIRCPKCDCTQTRFRLKTQDHQCYRCGYSWKDEVENE